MPLSSLSRKQLADVKSELTVSPIVPGAPRGVSPPSFPLWKQGASRLYVPKFYGLSKFGINDVRVTIPDGEHLSNDVCFTGNLRPEQLEPVRAFERAAEDPGRMGGILSLPCGCGKTVLALHIIAAIGRKTLIVVHKNFLLEQWRRRIEEFLPNARVGLIKAKTLDVEGKDVVLASLQSLSTKTYDPAVFSGFGLLVIDEVHYTGAEVFSRGLQKTNMRRSLGLSATVHRKDGMTKVFAWYIGDIVYEVKTSQDNGVRVLMLRFDDEEDLTYCEEPENQGGGLNTSRMINNVTRFAERTRFLTRQLAAVLRHNPTRKALVLSDRLDHLEDIRRRMYEDHDVRCGMYVGGMKPAALAESEKENVILATFSFASEGFDVPGMDTLVLASPKTDIEQSVGRILRQKPQDRRNVPLVLDIVDCFSVFEGQAKKRRSFYNKRKYEVRTVSRHREQDIDYGKLASPAGKNNDDMNNVVRKEEENEDEELLWKKDYEFLEQ